MIRPGTHLWQRSEWCWALLACAIPLGILFGPVLPRDRTFGLRDAAHYYAPLFRYVQSQWARGLPLWNPLEENGRPLLADPTASVLYPGKLVFALPCQFTSAYDLYIVAHIAGAAVAAYCAARRIGCRPISSGLAALAYAFGGGVCFQYCNVVYLVGAAWLPWGVTALVTLMGERPRRGLLALSVVLAMCVLGGDPQTAYLLMLMGWSLLPFCVSVDGESASVETVPTRWARAQRLASLSGRLIVAGLLAVALSAVQLGPSWSWARTTGRALPARETARSLPEWISRGASLRPEEFSGMLRPPEVGAHEDAVYRFSIGPWRWCEVVWPAAGGRPFPLHARWMDAIPAEGAYWTPSLYMGLWPALLGLTALRLRGRSDRYQRWLSWLVVLAALTCLGQYGLGWLANELGHACGSDLRVWPPIGGLYWLMTVLLPGFQLFRYPAKLWCVVALGLSLLAARQLETLDAQGLQRWGRRAARGAVLVLLILLLGCTFRAPLTGWLRGAPADALYGPLQISAVRHALLLSGLHVAIVLAAGWLITTVWRADAGRAKLGWLLLTAIELTQSQAWMLPTVAAADVTPPTVTRMQQAARRSGDAGGVSYLREPVLGWYPSEWAFSASPQRLADCMAWDRRTLRPKYNLDYGCRAVASVTSSSAADYLALLRLLQRSRAADQRLATAMRNVMGIDYVLTSAHEAARYTAAGWIVEPLGPVAQEDCLVRNPAAFPRAWIVHQALQLPPTQHTSWQQLDRRTQQVFCEGDQVRDLSRIVVIEADAPIEVANTAVAVPLVSATEHGLESCRITQSEPAEVTVEATLQQPGFLVLNDACADGWTCTLVHDGGQRVPLPVLRANRVMRAIALPAGDHRLVFRYRPAAVVWGGVISGLSWLAVLVACIVGRWRASEITGNHRGTESTETNHQG